MAGIYVHIPFCKKACHYCNFHFSTSFQRKDELIESILDEVKLQAGYLGDKVSSTIYFGGGTPSALPPNDLKVIVEEIRKFFPVTPDAEITLEINPDDVSEENLAGWKATGFNRLSIGIQALQDNLLAEWNRSHIADQAIQSIRLSKNAGFENISADLIYGSIGLTDEEWIRNIHFLINEGVPHISCYALTVETGTVLAHHIAKGKAKAPEDEQSHRQYSILQIELLKAGYEQYEISNFAKPGYRSKHNTQYWSGEHYLGLGPSAHSYDGISRQWNVANNIKYVHSIRNGIIPKEKEILTTDQCFNEIVMTGLRTADGISIERIDNLGGNYAESLLINLEPYLQSEKIFQLPGGNYALKPEQYFFADGIASDLFLVP